MTLLKLSMNQGAVIILNGVMQLLSKGMENRKILKKLKKT